MAKLSFLIVPLFLASFAYCLDDEIEERFRGMQNLMKTMQTSIDQLKQQVKETEEKCQVGNADFRRFVLDGEAPESVGFTAFVTAPDLLSLGHQHTIKFDYAETNVGNAYHTHTGMYVFHASAMSAPGQDQYLTFMKILGGQATVADPRWLSASLWFHTAGLPESLNTIHCLNQFQACRSVSTSFRPIAVNQPVSGLSQCLNQFQAYRSESTRFMPIAVSQPVSGLSQCLNQFQAYRRAYRSESTSFRPIARPIAVNQPVSGISQCLNQFQAYRKAYRSESTSFRPIAVFQPVSCLSKSGCTGPSDRQSVANEIRRGCTGPSDRQSVANEISREECAYPLRALGSVLEVLKGTTAKCAPRLPTTKTTTRVPVAVGRQVFQWNHNGFNTAPNQAFFDAAGGSWCGQNCGKCVRLTTTGGWVDGQGGHVSEGQSHVFMVTNLCPNVYPNTRWCSQSASNGQLSAIGWADKNPEVTWEFADCTAAHNADGRTASDAMYHSCQCSAYTLSSIARFMRGMEALNISRASCLLLADSSCICLYTASNASSRYDQAGVSRHMECGVEDWVEFWEGPIIEEVSAAEPDGR
ncbi:GUN-like protein, partial [Mya arenaria]